MRILNIWRRIVGVMGKRGCGVPDLELMRSILHRGSCNRGSCSSLKGVDRSCSMR